MKFLFLLTSMLVASGACVAQSGISPSMSAELKMFRLQSQKLHDGVLRVQLRDELVSPMVFDSMATGVCSEAARDPVGFKGMKISRLEVLNSVGAQGFALLNAGSVCERTSTMKAADGAALVSANVVRCEAGVCRRR